MGCGAGGVAGGGQQRDGAVLGLRGGGDVLRGLQGGGPDGGGGPAIIDDEQDGAGAGEQGRRAQSGAGQTDDEEGGGAEAEQEQPEGQPVRGLLGRRQIGKEGDGGEAEFAGRRRGQAEQKIERRQQRQGEEC